MTNPAKAAFFDAQVEADWAAAKYGRDERPKLERLIKEAELGPGQRVLEPGCGTGRLSQVLARVVGAGGEVAALDISAKMVDACRRKLAGLPQAKVLHASLEDYAAAKARFDRVVCHQVFPHFDDQPAALARLADLLTPGGVLAIVHFISAAEINDVHRKAGTAVEGDLLPSQDDMRRLIADAGLELEALTDDRLGYFLKARKPVRPAGG